MSAPSPPPSANRSAITARGGSIRVGGHTFVVRQRQRLRPSAVWRNPGCLSRRHCSCQTTLSLAHRAYVHSRAVHSWRRRERSEHELDSDPPLGRAEFDSLQLPVRGPVGASAASDRETEPDRLVVDQQGRSLGRNLAGGQCEDA